MDLSTYTQKFNVNYSDVDSDNKMTNRGFLRLLQEVAGIHVDLIGFGLNSKDKTGIAWLILNWKLKVFSRPKTNDVIIVKSWAKSKMPLYFYRNFEIYDNYNNIIAIATSKWVIFDIFKKRISKISDEVETNHPQLDKSVFTEKFKEKLVEPENSEFVVDYNVQRRDIDTNHHVNNLNYIDYALEVLPEEVYNNIKFENLEVMYKHEAKFGDTFSIYYSKTEQNEHIVTIKNKENKKLHAIVKMY